MNCDFQMGKKLAGKGMAHRWRERNKRQETEELTCPMTGIIPVPFNSFPAEECIATECWLEGLSFSLLAFSFLVTLNVGKQ